MPPSIRRTQTTLADGRELIYFDDSPDYVNGSKTRMLTDSRPLGDRFKVSQPDGSTTMAQGPQMRRDPLTGDWVPMASHRMNRTFLPAADSCPLCPAKPGADYSDGEIPDTDYDVVVFENRFPALLSVPSSQHGTGGSLDTNSLVNHLGLVPTLPAVGRCEVVCFSSNHDASLADLGTARIRTIIEAWADRTAVLQQLPNVQQVYCFENRGAEVGVTLSHPHGQIYAFPYVPPRTAAILREAVRHEAKTGGNLLRDILEFELQESIRVIGQSQHFVAYVPAAARWPVEVHLAPRRDIADFTQLTDRERDDLAEVYSRLLQCLDRYFIDPDSQQPIPLPYIAGWHQAVTGPGRQYGRLHLQIFSILRAPGKLKYLAGAESGLAAWISDTTPERIAKRLQEAW